MNKQSSRPLGPFLLTMLVFGIITTLHGLSPLASYGLGCLFFYAIALFGFLIPAGLVSADLGGRYPEDGGVYVWVKEGLGMRMGFLAIWLQWLQNLVFWPFILGGSTAMAAVAFGWDWLQSSATFISIVVLIAIWGMAWLTAQGLRISGWVAVLGALFGTILPACTLLFAAFWLLFIEGKSSSSPLLLDELVPDLKNPRNISFGISAILVFAGFFSPSPTFMDPN